MRSVLLFGVLFALTHLIAAFDVANHSAVIFYLEDGGVLSALREVVFLMLIVQLADWAFLPAVDLGALILGTDREAMPDNIRAATTPRLVHVHRGVGDRGRADPVHLKRASSTRRSAQTSCLSSAPHVVAVLAQR